MPRARKPTNVLKFTGAIAKNPQRGRERQHEPPRNGEIGEPPTDVEMNSHERLAWKRITEECPPGVLAKRDRQSVFILACLLGQVIGGVRDAKTLNAARVALNDFGMTPASASKVSAPPDEAAPSKFAAV
jgi:hypothetical protein